MARVGLTPQKVVLIGAQLSDELGFDRVTVSEIARRAGVNVASLYSHVTSLDDVRTRIALLALDELADRMAAELAGRSGQQALTALGNVYRDYARDHPGRYDAARVPLTPDDSPVGESHRRAGERHSAMMRAVLRGYDLGATDETHAVRLLGSIVHGFVSLERSGGFDHSQPSSDQSWARILETLDAMLLAWPQAGSSLVDPPPHD